MEHLRSANEKHVVCHPEIAVIGIGNLLMGDDGAGVHLVHQLAVKLKRTDVSVIDAGTVPDLFALVDEGVRKLIFVDAVRAGEPPGSVYRLKLDDIESQKELPFSLHDLTLIDNLKLMLSLIHI